MVDAFLDLEKNIYFFWTAGILRYVYMYVHTPRTYRWWYVAIAHMLRPHLRTYYVLYYDKYTKKPLKFQIWLLEVAGAVMIF